MLRVCAPATSSPPVEEYRVAGRWSFVLHIYDITDSQDHPDPGPAKSSDFVGGFARGGKV